MKIHFKNNRKNRTNLALLYLAVFFVVVTYLSKTNYIDFDIIRGLYMPIVGVSIIAILFDYLVFGHVFLLSSLYALVAKQIRGTVNINIIILFGFMIGLLLQMYIKQKNK